MDFCTDAILLSFMYFHLMSYIIGLRCFPFDRVGCTLLSAVQSSLRTAANCFCFLFSDIPHRVGRLATTSWLPLFVMAASCASSVRCLALNMCLILGRCTFGSDYSFKASWERSYELGTLVSGHFCPFLLAYPCKLHQVGWGALVHSHFQLFPQMFNWIQVWAQAGPLKDTHRLCSLGCVPQVVVMLGGKL